MMAENPVTRVLKVAKMLFEGPYESPQLKYFLKIRQF